MNALPPPVRPGAAGGPATDRPDHLLAVESLAVVDGDLDRDAYVALVRDRVLPRLPRFGQRVVGRRPWPGRWWEDDPDLDLDRHVHVATLPTPGDDAALAGRLSAVRARDLDVAHAPWEVHLLRGYRGGTAICTRLHPALAAEVAPTQVLVALADEAPVAGRAPTPPGRGVGLLRAVPRRVRAVPGVDGRATASAETPRLTRRRRAVWAPPIDVADLRPVCRATGTTVGDVLTAVLAGAQRRWLLELGADPVVDQPTLLPVALRGPAAPRSDDDLGPGRALVVLDLPVALDGALGRLIETAARLRRVEQSPEAWLTYGLLQVVGWTHPRVRALTTGLSGRRATGVVTSVRGPERPLHLGGHAVTRMWVWAPTPGDQRVSTSIVDYAGLVHVGFAVDAAAPDPEGLVAGLTAELAELTALAPRSGAPGPGWSPPGLHAAR